FQNNDLLQRALLLELDRGAQPNQPTIFDSEWAKHQIDQLGSREAWVAHHLLVLHHFFRRTKTDWNPRYQAHHRLINFEQAMVTMARVFNLPCEWLPAYLASATDKAMAEADWALEGLISFTRSQVTTQQRLTHITTADITSWALGEEEF